MPERSEVTSQETPYGDKMVDVQRAQGEAAPLLARARIATTAAELSLHAPPVDLRVKLVRTAQGGSLYIQANEECAFALVHEWVERWAPLRIEFGSRQVMRADFDPLPVPWATLFAGVQIDMLTLFADGRASLTITASHMALAAFSRRLSADILVEKVVKAPREAPLLTPGQESALRMAVAAGYYRIPRPLTLHQLAARLGISAAALSVRLRRAEGRVIERYIALGAATPLDARTIFSYQPPDDAADEGLEDRSFDRVNP